MKKLKDIHESLKTNQQNEEQVTVNQRHLIDKILARYSTEFTIFRELLQNSNDAGATQVTINLQTSNSNFITTIEYKNNGRPFLKEDWARLRKIAEGNPDEQKIGFFGVGFYSLFSICEEPFISSGVECMAFFWKGDQLFTKRGSLPERDELTTFLLELREPMDLMDIQSFGKFIATSLAFTKCLHEVTVNFNEICVLSFKKKVSNPKLVEFKKSSFNLSSPNKIFYLNEVELKKIQLDVSINLEYKNIDSVPIQSTLFMRTASAAFKVNTSRAMTHDMERTTKKKPPATTETHIMWSSHDEYESSTGCKGKNPVFDDLVPNKEEQGKVFIGFPTHQTTGCAIHFMSHLIPTVERESIDFVDKTLNLWNQELLSTTGLLARILYVDEFASIKDMFENVPKPIDPEIYSWLLKRSLHAMLSFTFKPTTPNNLVGRIVSKYFFISAPNEIIEIMSTRGVLAANNVRVFSAEPMGGYERKFIKNTATVPDEILIKCSVLINNLMSDNTIQQINFKDVLSELNSNFTVDEVVKLLKWFIMYRDNCTLNSNELETFLKNLVLPVTGDSANKNLKLTLSNIKYWINPKVITPGLSVPEDSFPLEISKHFSKTELEHYFGNIKELSLSEWTIFISKNEDLVLSPHFSEKVLSTISRSFMSVSNQQKHSIVSTLKDLSCIPTKQGMKKPCDAYFKNVNLFDDIPVVLFPSQIIKKDEASETSTKSVTSFFGGLLSNAVEKISSSIRQSPVSEVFLKSLGVREHVELQVVFDRLDSLNWDHYQLIKYLASVSNKLSEKEYSQLKATPLFPKQTLDSSTDNFRYKAMDLYAPTEEIKELGLPILSWKGRWHKNTEEAKLLSLMGLKQQIPLFELLLLTSKSADRVQQTKFLAYFVENFSIYEESYSHVKNTPELSPFLPSTNVKGENILSKPNDCFSDPGCSLMGFNVLRPDLVVNAEKFGVRKYPNSVELVRYLERSPPKSEEAAAVFEFLSYQKFSNYDWKTLRGLKFIPLNRKGAMVYEAPYKVYFVGLESSQFQNYFDFVDFGQVGNSFLRNCGVKDEPTPTELAQLLVRSPLQFFEDSGLDSYLSLLRQIAAHYHVLRSNTALKKEMMQSSFLVGLINDVSEEEEINDETREGKTSEKVRNPQLSYKLAKAGDIFLIDDTILQQIFTPLGCPMEALLEGMYSDLGSSWLSSKVTILERPMGETKITDNSKNLELLIHDRAALLLFDGVVASKKDITMGSEKILKSLKVFEVPEIKIERKFMNKVNLQKTGASVMQDKNTKKFFLFISGEFDYFDVSSSICKLIFKNPRLNDRLLVSTLLSTSLSNLKRKGFPVERILNLQSSRLQQARLIEEEKKAAQLKNKPRVVDSNDPQINKTPANVEYNPPQIKNDSNSLSKDLENIFQQLALMFPNIDPNLLKAMIEEQSTKTAKSNILSNCSNLLLDSNYAESDNNTQTKSKSDIQTEVKSSDSLTKKEPEENSVLSNLSEKFKNSGWSSFLGSSRSNSPLSTTLPAPSRSNEDVQRAHEGNINKHREKSAQQDATQVPISRDFTKNLQNHLKQSLNTLSVSNESSFRAQTPSDPPAIPASQASSRCKLLSDADLNYIGDVAGLKLYINKAAKEKELQVVLNGDGTKRFAEVLKILAKVFDVTPKSFHMYWDDSGPVVAFNRGRTLFFNLRFYLGLHDKPSKKMETLPGSFFFQNNVNAVETYLPSDSETYYYWFLTTCHELAHNFVSEHNAEHEFYMSSFAENYLKKMINVLKLEGIEV